MTPFDFLLFLLILSGLSMAAIGLYARRFISRVPAATPFILLMFLASAWSILFFLALIAPSLSEKVFLHNLRFLFLPFIPVAELWLVLAYVNRPEWIRRDLAAPVLVIPVIAAILGLTYPFHTLFRYDFSLAPAGTIPMLRFSEGPFFAVYNLYSLALLVLALAVLVIESRRRGTLWEMPTILLFIALAFPTALNYAFMALPGLFSDVNPTPALLWIAALLYLVALFRFRFLDIIPVARSRVIETMSQPMLILDTDERIIDMNPAAEHLFSEEKSVLLGQPVAVLFARCPSLADLVRQPAAGSREILAGDRVFDGVIEPVQGASGRTIGSSILLMDITGRKRTEEALRMSEEKYRAIIDNMQDVVYRTDLAGNLLMVSPSGARLAGSATADSLIGRPIAEFYADPADRSAILAAMQEQGSVHNYSLILKTPDGTRRHATVSSQYFLNPDGTVGGVDGVIHDITDLRHAEEALRTANKKLSLLSGITRHDIKNQLLALRGYIELSESALDNREKLAHYLSLELMVADNIGHQISFTRDYEDLGVKSAVWQDVSALVRDAASSLPLGMVRFEDSCNGLEVYADPLLIKVFYNLIDNSLRYGGDGMTAIRISSRPDGRNLQILHEDDGTGISAADKRKLFSKGFGRHSGLGLFLSREILAITGITITEDGEPGRGVRFVITVPEGMYRSFG